MNQFLRRLLNLDVVDAAIEVAKRREQQMERMQLEHMRNLRDLVEQFWVAQEAGIDVREQLHAGLEDLRDHVARLEEHAK